MDGSRQTTNFLLLIIALVLLFGAGALKSVIGFVFWAIVIIAGAIFILWIIIEVTKDDKGEQLRMRKEQSNWETENPGWKRGWFGISYKEDPPQQTKQKRKTR